MLRVKFLLLIAITLLAGLSCLPATGFARDTHSPMKRVGTIHVPGQSLKSFDIGFVNDNGVYALADRSNGSLDFFSAASDRFIGRVIGFRQFNATGGSDDSGPNGVVAVGRYEFWAGDGDSTVKMVDLRTRRVIASVSTGGKRRADELAYDARDHLLVAVNNADDPPFVTFISTRTRKIVGKLELPHATNGAEQPVWNPVSGLVYLSIPVLDHVKANGAVAVIDPKSHRVLRLLPVQRCMPAGLTLGPKGDLLVACSDDAIDAGFPARSFVLDGISGKVVAQVRVGGSDEAWSDPKSGRYFLAASAMPGGPVLGVVDLRANRLIATLPTGPHAHSVAADPQTGKAFVPIAADGTSPDCANGCIAVFGTGK